MGLKSAIRAATKAGIEAIGDLAKVKSVTYKQLVEAAYDATLGQTVAKINVYPNLTITFVDFDRRLIDGQNILPTDQRALIAGDEIQFKPESGGDTVEFINDFNVLEEWEVVNVKTDPAAALWDLQVRRRK